MRKWDFEFNNLWVESDLKGAAKFSFFFIPFMIGVCDWMVSIIVLNFGFTWKTLQDTK